MNGITTINQMVEHFECFKLEEKEYLVDIFTKELREEKREKIFKRYLESTNNRRKGKVKIGNIQNLRADIYEEHVALIDFGSHDEVY